MSRPMNTRQVLQIVLCFTQMTLRLIGIVGVPHLADLVAGLLALAFGAGFG